jgi:hypothetical protein
MEYRFAEYEHDARARQNLRGRMPAGILVVAASDPDWPIQEPPQKPEPGNPREQWAARFGSW